jgi:hypothetical protein
MDPTAADVLLSLFCQASGVPAPESALGKARIRLVGAWAVQDMHIWQAGAAPADA